MADRLMPEKMHLGDHHNSILRQSKGFRDNHEFPNPTGLRMIMGFKIPEWQRPLVWSREQSIAFIQSAWLGLPLGSYSYNMFHDAPELDGLLVDGQQRMYALEQYFDDQFPVFGHHWSEVTKVDSRGFLMGRIFASYAVKTDDEEYLKAYYNRMNFGGVAHTEDQRA
ncbi:DUF262 domain-containing protein [Salipiger sp. PrR003]|uniref:DUF262 domain-containing protein n=1 Tax=Salipiger sp. PrR003 TaxID=2706776 RepID=UPI0013DB545E|nr:DUF262 domain-containing protein [Salipiger sp. PrR003]NDV51524.1 DUF262 domain-containing protein [Salipiger sp. PrR003]